MNIAVPRLKFNVFEKKIKTVDWDNFFQIYREPVVTYCITPNNSPIDKKNSRSRRMSSSLIDYDDFEGDEDDFFYEDDYSITSRSSKGSSEYLINTIAGLFNKFYLPERIRFSKKGIRVKMNDVVSYKIVFQNGTMKFYLTVPQKWAKNFTNAIRTDWGHVDITKISEEIIDFNPNRAKAMHLVLKNHYCLSLRNERNRDLFYPSISSVASIMDKEDKMIIDFNIEPYGNNWKNDAIRNFNKIKKGKVISREEKSHRTIINAVLEFANTLMNETSKIIHDLMNIGSDENKNDDDKYNDKHRFRDTSEKLRANSNGFRVQTRVIAETNDHKKTKHLLKNVQNSFSVLDGDNKFEVRNIRTRRGIKTTIKAVKDSVPIVGYGKDIFYEKEVGQVLRMPSKQTLKEYKQIIEQDNFTRTEIDSSFLDENNYRIATTIEKDARNIYMPTYDREWWTDKGRKAIDKTKLDDNCQAELLFGAQGSGKTSKIIRDALQKFGANLPLDEWKEKSKSVVVFDVADGEIVYKIYNHIRPELRHRVIILNHSKPEQPIPVNFSELEEFNRKTMNDPDYSYKLAEMEALLFKEILQSDKSILVDRWFTTALQVTHMADFDYGYAEAVRFLVDDEFRINEIMPKIKDERMLLEIEVYNELRASGKTDNIIMAIQNRFTQIERDSKLWDCIAQKPLRDAYGNCLINFRRWLDGDEDGAYMVLIYIPKDGVSNLFRKFIFAHYFLKIWNVALSREKGFAGREYRPEAECIIDELHQILDIPIVAKTFIDIFKEPRKYSLKIKASLHGWSSIAKAGRGMVNDIKQSIMDNGCNLVMLRGGKDAFESLSHFLKPMTPDDFDNLMNMQWCGIFGIKWDNKYHVFQAKLPINVDDPKSGWVRYSDWDLYKLSEYVSPYSRNRDEVRSENLKRIKSMLKKTMMTMSEDAELTEGTEWEDIEKVGTRGKRSAR